MSNIDSNIKQINELEFRLFNIPEYQRPYSWDVMNVRQLWDDIGKSFESNKEDYRIGTIILHNNNKGQTDNALDIVDGQQRITTLCLILLSLKSNNQNDLYHSFLAKKQFGHSESVSRIRINFDEISSWIKEENTNKELLFKYIFYCCSFVEIKVDSVEEAFQMFDSQNGRGLELEAYNLLKAFHIRAFSTGINQTCVEDIKIQCDQNWEKAAKDKKLDYLKQVINEQLYRTRIWARRKNAYEFNKTKISEFKGVTIESVNYPYQNIVHFYAAQVFPCNHLIMRCDSNEINNLIQINQPIINGFSFFDYVQNYISTYKILFEECKVPELIIFNDFYKTFCNYKTNRIGDKYLLELYKSLIMIIFDMYGTKGLSKYYKVLYAFVYRLRLEKKYVKYETVAKYPKDIICRIIYSHDLIELSSLKIEAFATIIKQTDVPLIENFLTSEFNINISRRNG